MPSLAAASQGGSSASLLILLLPLLLIGLMFWTQRRRSRQFQQAQSQLNIGDEVSTTSGLLGTLVALEDEIGSLEVAPGVVLRFDRRAIVPATVTSGPTDATTAPEDEAPAEDSTPADDAAADTDTTGKGTSPSQGS
ncbi:preprotein translocase subunit YajC [Luteipulveratus mongoliensis]|uniref:Preprotein translocase subunit YajC n=1 Tax=Luteipulveratus mongoliensis TaxID=571913 RepID=A0A0K1JJZ6_9MICO|nr:preprotein translocase subunit YajC [Luteipulveratus mongoliensis]AKU16895.1 hypothetical protein VV02_15170 [Luteipulveratus mongoliensis]